MKLIQISLQKRGAAAIDAFEMSEALCAHGLAHAVVLSTDNELKRVWAPNEHRELHWVKTYRSNVLSFAAATLTFWRIFKIKRLLKNLSAENLYATHFHPWLYWLLKGLPGKKFLTYHENPFDAKEPDRLVNWQKKLLSLADVLVTHSEFVKTELRKVTAKPIVALPLGSYEAATRNWDKPEHRQLKKILFFGRIIRYKGLETIVAAMEILNRKNIPAAVTLAGSGQLEPELKQRLSAFGAEIINRWLEFDEMVQLFQTHDAVLVPYSKATQSGVASLALAFGLPVIAAPSGGLPEQVKNGVSGLLADGPEALAAAIEKLYNDPELYQRLRAGTAEVKKEVSWLVAAEKLIRNLS